MLGQPAAASNAGDPIVFEGEVVDGGSVPELRAGFDRCVDEHLVQRRAPWRDPDRDAVHDKATSGQWEVAEVHCDRGDRRAAGRDHPVEQPPGGQPRRAVHVNVMPVGDLARESRPVNEQHIKASTC